MKNVKVSLAEQLKAELMERYGLREDQVNLQVSVYTTDLELGRTILKDFNTKYSTPNELLLQDGKPCDSVYSSPIHIVSVHRKDGFYGAYVVGDNDEC